MRIVEVKLKSDHPYTQEEVDALNAARVIYSDGQVIKLDENGKVDYYWRHFLMFAHLLPLCPYTLEKVIVNDDGFEGIGEHAASLRPLHINQKVNVAVPGFGLMMINRVEVFTDYCTESLQERLNDGWKILAICPQPNQRRPDYVLGKSTRSEE